MKIFSRGFCSLTPHQKWLVKGQNMERPFTGHFWSNQEVGTYHCVSCSHLLFKSEMKYQTASGMASFWTHEPNHLKVSDEEDHLKDINNLDVLKYKHNLNGKKCTCAKVKISKSVLHLWDWYLWMALHRLSCVSA